MKEISGALKQRELDAISDLEPLYNRLSTAPGREAVKNIRNDLDEARSKYAALATDSLLVRSVFELLEAAWLLRHVHWNRALITGSTLERITGGIANARKGLKNYRRPSSPQDDKIKRLMDYCTHEALMRAIWHP